MAKNSNLCQIVWAHLTSDPRLYPSILKPRKAAARAHSDPWPILPGTYPPHPSTIMNP
jgi:hypothetical protein